jgi:tetratricopeptide (TPR) repeat protein
MDGTTAESAARLPSSRVLVVALAALTLLVYANSAFNGFVWDDEFIIVDNPSTRDVSGIGELLSSPDVVEPYYRPLTRVTYLLNFVVFGMSPVAFHAVNIGIHVLNVLLLFQLGQWLFGSRIPAALAAALLAIHPINTETVDFVSARNNLLVLLFVQASLLLLLQGRRKRSLGYFSASGLVFFLGLLSKETAAASIAILVVFAFLPMGGQRPTLRQGAVALLPHFLVSVAYGFLRSEAIGGLIGVGAILPGLAERLADNAIILPRYLGLVLFPVGLTTAHDEPNASLLDVVWLLPAWAAILFALWRCARRRTLPTLLGLLWFAVNLLPVANIIPIPSTTIAERYLYVPAVGLWIIAADFACALHSRVSWKRTLETAAVAVALLLCAVTVKRNLDWKDDLSLFQSVVRVDPLSTSGHFNLGNTLLESRDFAGARREWETVLRLDPTHTEALTQLGTMAASSGDLARAERLYVAALETAPDNAMAHFNLARIYEQTGRLREALAQYDAFLGQEVHVEYRGFIPVARERRARLVRHLGGRGAPESGPAR